ncbi:MAG: ACT domain-containing protein [Candidatus Rokubacteria bacterium]|nr:ACT domain-containing protein [Candidatus Rokubacteria bacterium]
MAVEFTVLLENVPGTLAHLGSVLGDARVNIEAIQGFNLDGRSRVQFVAQDPDGAARALETDGIAYTSREVLVARVLDEPGTLGEVALVMAKAGINIDSVYLTTRGDVVLGVDDLTGATHVAAGMAVMTSD